VINTRKENCLHSLRQESKTYRSPVDGGAIHKVHLHTFKGIVSRDTLDSSAIFEEFMVTGPYFLGILE
jgi:hypothetical protein